jgi:hypothetical protein
MTAIREEKVRLLGMKFWGIEKQSYARRRDL